MTVRDAEPGVDTDFSFSGMLRQRPAAVLRVGTEAEAVAAIDDARRRGVAVNFRGAGHSFGDRCISDGGLLLINEIDAELVFGEHSVTAPTGLTWHALERRLNQAGRSAPVLTNWLGATVGGTLAYAGFGVSSYRRGAQVDQVSRVRLVDGNAEVLTLAPGDPLWSVALSCSGALGLVTSVEMATVPYLPYLREAAIRCADEQQLAHTLMALAERAVDAEMLWAQLSAEQLLICLGQRIGAPDQPVPALDALPGAVASVRSWDSWLQAQSTRQFPPRIAYLWSDYVVPARAFHQFFTAAYDAVYRSGLAQASRPRIRVLVVDRGHSPPATHALNPVNFPGQQSLFGIGVYLEPSLDQPDMVAAAQACLAGLLSLCLALGGRPYFATWHEMDGAQAAQAYPGAWEYAQQALAAHADRALTNPGSMPPL
jgi:FAD/FMN-containing dehydrogenase